MLLPQAILWLLALGFAGFGTAYALWPTSMAALTDIELPTVTARIDFAATYGGLQLGFAMFLALCAARRRPVEVRTGLLASGWTLLGLGTVRAAGAVASGAAGSAIYAGLSIELVSTALAFWAAGRVSAYGPEPDSRTR